MTAAIPAQRSGDDRQRQALTTPLDCVFAVPYWDRLDGMVRCTEGLVRWLRSRNIPTDIWTLSKPTRPGAVWTPRGELWPSTPRTVVSTMGATFDWANDPSVRKGATRLAVYLHGRSSWQQAQRSGNLSTVERWFVPSKVYDWGPGWPPDAPVVYVPPGFDPARFSPDLSDPPVAPPAVLFINPTEKKGARLVLELAKRMPAQRFIVVGGRRGRTPGFESLPNVELLDYQEDMVPLYRRARALLVPSFHECAPLVVVEAAACGVPSVCSDLPTLHAVARGRCAGAEFAPVPFATSEEVVAAWQSAIERTTADHWQRGYLARRNALLRDPGVDFEPLATWVTQGAK